MTTLLQQVRIHGFSSGPVKAWLVYAPWMNERDTVEPLPAMKTTKNLQLNTKSKRLKSHGINLADPTKWERLLQQYKPKTGKKRR